MAYIGAQPNKQLTKTTSQSFNGTGSATAFTLNRAVNTGEELEVFVDNVQQEPGSGKSYTATGTTLTFDEAPPLGTGNVYVIYRGQAEVTTRLEAPDLSITTAKIASNAVDLTSKVTGALPVANGGTALTSGFANGITEIDIWYKSANETISSGNNHLTSHLLRWATEWEKIGTGMTESSGVFTFPSTGKWRIFGHMMGYTPSSSTYSGLNLRVSTDSGSNFAIRNLQYQSSPATNAYFGVSLTSFLDVTNASTFRVKFHCDLDTSTVVTGASAELRTYFAFEKIADT